MWHNNARRYKGCQIAQDVAEHAKSLAQIVGGLDGQLITLLPLLKPTRYIVEHVVFVVGDQLIYSMAEDGYLVHTVAVQRHPTIIMIMIMIMITTIMMMTRTIIILGMMLIRIELQKGGQRSMKTIRNMIRSIFFLGTRKEKSRQ
jgi:hypothetical protein